MTVITFVCKWVGIQTCNYVYDMSSTTRYIILKCFFGRRDNLDLAFQDIYLVKQICFTYEERITHSIMENVQKYALEILNL